MAEWSWVIGDPPPGGVEQRELTQATARSVTWRLDAPCTAKFKIDGRSDEAAGISELATDLTIYRDGVKVFRGRIAPSSDEGDPTSHQCEFHAVDYRGMLENRFFDTDHGTYEDVDQATIAFDLIDVTQQRVGGDWGITDGLGATSGTLRDRSYDIGKPIGQAVAELGRVDGGFEWEIDAELALNRWHPTRGADNGVVLDYGGTVTRFRRALSPDDFANAVQATGSDVTSPAPAIAAGIGADLRGRWERTFSYPSITIQQTLDDRAQWLLDQTSTLRPKWAVTLTPERWEGFSHLALGDTVLWVCESGRLSVHSPHRNVEMAVAIADTGDETLTCGLVMT